MHIDIRRYLFLPILDAQVIAYSDSEKKNYNIIITRQIPSLYIYHT